MRLHASALPSSPRLAVIEATGFACCPPATVVKKPVPLFITQQACWAGPNKSGPPNTHAASRSGTVFSLMREARDLEASCPVKARDAHGQATLTLFGQIPASASRLCRPFRPVPRHGWSNQASGAVRPAGGWQTPPMGGSVKTQRANPSVKGTSCGKPQAAPYVELQGLPRLSSNKHP